jgi:isoleucyl-tRNA synthetase
VAKYQIKTHKPLGADDFYVKNYTDEDEKHPDYKTTDVIISIILKEENKAFKVEKYEHTYPHSWRTDKPVLYYPLDAWFIKTTALKDKMVALNKTINWKPESTGTGRFGNWLENLVDWNLSRSRYWGTPLPIWRTKDGREEICIGSIEELKTEVEKANKVNG